MGTELTFSGYLSSELDVVKDALPKDFNKTRFVQNCIALINDHPELQKYSQTQLKMGLFKGAYLGLDFFNKECHLVGFGSQLQFLPDYRGSIKLCKKYSFRPIKDIYAEIVREGDVFEKSIVNNEQVINFKPLPFNDGKVVGAFAVCLYKDGGIQTEVMSLKELETTRSSSKAKNSPAWSKFTTEMYKKTVLHRLCKHIPLEFENAEQLSAFNEGMEINETVKEEVAQEIQNNANQEEFEADFEVID